MQILDNGIKKYQVGFRAIWDMREAKTGGYKASSLKENDIVIYTDRKAYLIDRNSSYRKLEKQELRQVIEEIDFAILQYEQSRSIQKDDSIETGNTKISNNEKCRIEFPSW